MRIESVVVIPKLLSITVISVENVSLSKSTKRSLVKHYSALFCIRKLELNLKKINTKGSGIALGHPLRATEARQVSSLLPKMKRLGSELGVVSMCVGTSMSLTGLFVRE